MIDAASLPKVLVNNGIFPMRKWNKGRRVHHACRFLWQQHSQIGLFHGLCIQLLGSLVARIHLIKDNRLQGWYYLNMCNLLDISVLSLDVIMRPLASPKWKWRNVQSFSRPKCVWYPMSRRFFEILSALVEREYWRKPVKPLFQINVCTRFSRYLNSTEKSWITKRHDVMV